LRLHGANSSRENSVLDGILEKHPAGAKQAAEKLTELDQNRMMNRSRG